MSVAGCVGFAIGAPLGGLLYSVELKVCTVPA